MDCGPLPDVEQQTADRTALEAAYYSAAYEGGSLADFLALALTYDATYGDDSGVRLAEGLKPTDPPPPPDLVLDVPHMGQINNTYCGLVG